MRGHWPRFDTTEWRAELARWPDLKAAGRWARLLIWFYLIRSIKPEGNAHKFENRWDDAHYAFLSSYAGAIVTKDREIKDAVEAVFGERVVALSDLPDRGGPAP